MFTSSGNRISMARSREPEKELAMTIELPDLPHTFDALAPVISGATLRTRHGRFSNGSRVART